MSKRNFSRFFLLLSCVVAGAAMPARAQQTVPASAGASAPPAATPPPPPAEQKPAAPSQAAPQTPLRFDDAELSLAARKFIRLSMSTIVPPHSDFSAKQKGAKIVLTHLWPTSTDGKDCAGVESTLAIWSELLGRLQQPSPVILITIATKDSPAAKCIASAASQDAPKGQAVFGPSASHFQTEVADFRQQLGHTLVGQPATLVYDSQQTSWRGFVGPVALPKGRDAELESDTAAYRAEEILSFVNLLLQPQRAEPARAAGYDMRVPPAEPARTAFARSLIGTVVHPRMCGFWGDFAKKNQQEVAICKRWAAARAGVGSVRVLLLADKRHDRNKAGVYTSMGNLLTNDALQKAKRTRRISFEFLPNQSGDGSALLLLIDSQGMIRYAQVVNADVSNGGQAGVVLDRLLQVLPKAATKFPFPRPKAVPNR